LSANAEKGSFQLVAQDFEILEKSVDYLRAVLEEGKLRVQIHHERQAVAS
jgi:hypothetical protein